MFVVGRKCLERVEKLFNGADKNADGTVNMAEAMRLLAVTTTKETKNMYKTKITGSTTLTTTSKLLKITRLQQQQQQQQHQR